MEHQRKNSNGQKICNGDPGRDHLSDHQIHATKQERQCGDLTDGTHAVTEEHVQNGLLGESGHDHMMQRSSGADTVNGLIDSQTHRPDQHQESASCKSGIEDVLAKSAKETFCKDDSEETSESDLPIRNSRRKRHGKKQTGDHSGTVHDSIPGPGHHMIQPLGHNGRSYTDQCDHGGTIAKADDTNEKCRDQCKNDIQHDAVSPEITADMRRRSNSQFHLIFASLTACLPLRKVSTRGSLPGQVKAQLPHSMQSSKLSLCSSLVRPAS